MRLNLGCGTDIRSGWVNVDRYSGPGVDMTMDLSKPLPFNSDSISEVYVSHVFEHILNWEDLLREIHRILEPSGIVVLKAPYGLCLVPYHVRYFHEHTLDQFLVDITEVGTSLEVCHLFKQRSRTVNRRMPGHWHFRRYLRFDFPRWLDRFGKRSEIVWVLEKVVKGDEKGA